MARCNSGQVVVLALAIGSLLGAAGCASRAGKNAPPVAKDSPEAGVGVSTPSVTEPAQVSALQRFLAKQTPAAATLPGAIQKRVDAALDGYLQRIQTNRIYISLDKPIYQPGETIWFRTWELGTSDLLPATRSGQGMAFQLVSPKGAVVMQKRVAIKAGVARNDFRLPDGVPGGEYKIRIQSDTGHKTERSVIVSNYHPPRIKKTLEFVRKAYGAGDKVSAALSVHRATGEPLGGVTVTAIAEVDGLEVIRKPVVTSAKGTALVRFELPAQINRGDGLLTILVEDGGVTESIQRPIPIVLKKLRFALFPEGGSLVEGLPGRVYFAAQTLIRKPADVRGEVVDDAGTVVARFSSFHEGMGRFDLTPEKGRTYRVKITRPVGIAQTFPVPAPLSNGCSMQAVDDFESKRADVRVAVWCSEPRTVIATATLRERKLATHTVDVAAGAPSIIALPSPRWNQGAARVTLFSDRGAPLAERLVYRGRGTDMRVKITTNRASYAPRDRVELTIETTDPTGKPVAADLALAVVDDTVLSYADDKTAHLLAKIYLEHEMPGQKIPKPNFYFSDKPKAAPALDLVLGTLGWRRFTWRLILAPESGAETQGDKWDASKGYHTYNAPPAGLRGRTSTGPRTARRVLRVLRRHAGGAPVAPVGSASAPSTLFSQVVATGSLRGVVRDQKGKPLASVRVVAYSMGTRRTVSTMTDASGRYAFARLSPGMYRVSFYYRGVSVSRRVSVRLGRAATLSGRIDTTRARVRPTSATGGIATPSAAQPAPMRRRRPRIQRKPMRPGEGARPMPAGRAQRRPARDVRRPGKRRRRNMGRMQRRGPRLMAREAKKQDKDWAAQEPPVAAWAVIREFPAPTYSATYDGPRTDFRETIHWAPLVRTGKDGKTTVSFYLSDSVTSFRATVQGVSDAGRLGRAEAQVKSKLPVSLVAKLPLEVSAGDELELPVTLTNETTRAFTATITARFGRAFKVRGGAPSRVKIAAGERKSYFYKLQVVGNGRRKKDGHIALSVSAAKLTDELERTVSVVPLGFPQEVSIAGTVESRARHTVDLAGALPGTIDATLTMYPSPLATMTKGTEAIIREPHGCFEQASSANYPNVMVLSYLENYDAADPALVTRTHALLEKGYRKLTGYESKKRGYEWFGGDPGHEALTAYGLMEFSDMAKVYKDIDPVMVKRTAGWLLSRRDGKGGYKRNARALDSFGKASPEVTNGYISWALSQSGRLARGPEVDEQGRIARTTKDPYLMALATGVLLKASPAAETTKRAVTRLAAMRNEQGAYLGANHSITRSGGRALEIETTSLAVLALLDAGSTQLAHVRPSIAWLDKQRSGFGGYGSTQSTILALKALTRYAELSRVTRSSGVASVFINGKKVRSVSFAAGRKEALEFGDLAAYLRAGTNKIEVRLDSKEPLPYSMAISYRRKMPRSSKQAKVAVSTRLAKRRVPWGEGVKMHVSVRNLTTAGVPMTLARVGIPGGLTFQTWQLDELKKKGVIDFYETRAREVVLYFRSMQPSASKELQLALMATVPGTYVAPASRAYLYYTDEHVRWSEPVRVEVVRK